MTRWIRTREELVQLAAELSGCRTLAIDSESDSLYHHFEKVCLLQIASDRGEAVLVDPLAVRQLDPLAPLFADPAVTKVLHGADYDVTTLKRDFGFVFTNVFDTMIAARFLGRREFGLQALLRAELNVELSKASQKDDWSERPLSAQQEAYALSDVLHLLPLATRLGAELQQHGRLAWVREECDAVTALGPASRKKDVEAYRKVKGAETLQPRQLAVLRELHAWREGRAEATDKPPFKIVGNDVLLDLAARAPATIDEVASRIARYPRVRREADQVHAALLRAQALPQSELPAVARPSRPPRRSPQVAKRIEQLKAWRAAEVERSGLEAMIVLPQRLIDKLAEAAPRELGELQAIDGLRRWRIEAYGKGLLVP